MKQQSSRDRSLSSKMFLEEVACYQIATKDPKFQLRKYERPWSCTWFILYSKPPKMGRQGRWGSWGWVARGQGSSWLGAVVGVCARATLQNLTPLPQRHACSGSQETWGSACDCNTTQLKAPTEGKTDEQREVILVLFWLMMDSFWMLRLFRLVENTDLLYFSTLSLL